jgi:hypothetical protein
MTKSPPRSHVGKLSAALRMRGHSSVASAVRMPCSCTAFVAFPFGARRMDSSASAVMTKGRRVQHHELRVQIEPIPQDRLDACARVVARLAVEKALGLLALDRSDQLCDDVGNQHKVAPSSAETPNGAKEQVS